MFRKLLAVCVGIGVVASLSAADAVAPAKTLANLQKAYSDGMNAKAQYEAFAAKADEEGFKSVAVLFKASVRAEGIHVAKFESLIKAANAVPKADVAKVEAKTTKENLLLTVKTVNGNSSVLSDFAKQAEADKDEKATMFFKGTREDQASRAKLYRQAADELDNWKAAGKEFVVCAVCGFTTSDVALKLCPICTSPREKFEFFK